MEGEFGRGYARSVAHDLTLDAVGGRTADDALEAGVPAREVWLALCDALDVPPERRFGKARPGRGAPNRSG